MERVRLNVRCCCQPIRVYGTLLVPKALARAGAAIYLSLPGGERLRLEVARVSPYLIADTEELALRYEGDNLSFEQKLERIRHAPGFEELPCN